jgi:hypothetical protein
LFDALARTRDWVQAAYSTATTGLCYVHRTCCELGGYGRFLEHGFTRFQRCLYGLFGHINARTSGLAFFGRQTTEQLQLLSYFALLAEQADANGIEGGEIRTRGDFHAGGQNQIVEVAQTTAP